MMSIERYESLIKSSLEIQQKRIEINRELRIIADNITASELTTRSFDREAANKAILILKDTLNLEKANYVKGAVNYKDVKISLHKNIDDEGWKFMGTLLEAISNKDVLNR